jgi:hypothetical protein
MAARLKQTRAGLLASADPAPKYEPYSLYNTFVQRINNSSNSGFVNICSYAPANPTTGQRRIVRNPVGSPGNIRLGLGSATQNMTGAPPATVNTVTLAPGEEWEVINSAFGIYASSDLTTGNVPAGLYAEVEIFFGVPELYGIPTANTKRAVTAKGGKQYSLTSISAAHANGPIALLKDRVTYCRGGTSETRMLQISTDYGTVADPTTATWTNINLFSGISISDTIESVVDTDDGEVLLATRGTGTSRWFKSSGWSVNKATATWTQTHSTVAGTFANQYCGHQFITAGSVVVVSTEGSQILNAQITASISGTTLTVTAGTANTGSGLLVVGRRMYQPLYLGGTYYGTILSQTSGTAGREGVYELDVNSGTVASGTMLALDSFTQMNDRARFVWLSNDYGATFNQIFEVRAFALATGLTEPISTMHVHGVAFDADWSRIYVCFGDNAGNTNPASPLFNNAAKTSKANGFGFAQVAYSDDLGVTWGLLPTPTNWLNNNTDTTTLQFIVPTITPESIAFNIDLGDPSAGMVYRKTGFRKYGESHPLVGLTGAGGINGRSGRFGVPGNYTYSLAGYNTTRNLTGLWRHYWYLSPDGIRWHQLYTEGTLTSGPDGVKYVLGPDANGKITVVHGSDQDGVSGGRFKRAALAYA